MPTFACDARNIATFLRLLGDRTLRPNADETAIVIDGQPDGPKSALARELLESMQPFLLHSYVAAAKWTGKDASFPYYHHPCGEWRLMTKARSKSQCTMCVDSDRKHPRTLIALPWAEGLTNRHGRTTLTTLKHITKEN